VIPNDLPGWRVNSLFQLVATEAGYHSPKYYQHHTAGQKVIRILRVELKARHRRLNGRNETALRGAVGVGVGVAALVEEDEVVGVEEEVRLETRTQLLRDREKKRIKRAGRTTIDDSSGLRKSQELEEWLDKSIFMICS
jgi:hypothetical protein